MYDQLLGWMHGKLRQNSNDVFKEFNNGGGTFISSAFYLSVLFLAVYLICTCSFLIPLENGIFLSRREMKSAFS